MRHNKFIGWDKFLEVVEQVQRYSPWLSRQIAKRAAEWPFWFSGLQIREWEERQVRVHMPLSVRNSLDGEICQGHLLLGAELTLRLLLLRYSQEIPFRFRLTSSRIEVQHVLDQAVDYRFAIPMDEWERIRLDLLKSQKGHTEFVLQAYLKDGRVAATFQFGVGFQLEKFLPA